jgi:hypothetical protein
MMTINDLIGFPKEWISKSKLHFAIGAKSRHEPLYAFYKNQFQVWQNSQNNKNFELEYIFSLIYYAKHEWLYAGVYKRTGLQKVDGKYYYSTELQDIGKELIGRLIIRYEKKFRASYPYLNNHIDKLQLLEVLREPYTVEPFPGFDKVCIGFDLLKSIIEQEEKTWKTALANVKGIYLITDTSNGKQYIGSGYGVESLWKRWSDYAKSGHGGNKKLKEIQAEQGPDYAINFQFTILETRNINTDKDEIIRRETHWKNVLLSREFGYNIN